MLFKRRSEQGLWDRFRLWLWPRRSFRRSALYYLKRILRLTGTPYLALYKQAVAAPTLAKRHELVIEMQKLEYNQGGYIIPFFNNLIDAYSSKVVGFVPSKGTLNLDAFGHGFRTISFA